MSNKFSFEAFMKWYADQDSGTFPVGMIGEYIDILNANVAPVASDSFYGGVEEDGEAFSFAYNATDADGDFLTYVIATQPFEGSVVDNADGTFTFDPGVDFQDLAEGEIRQVSFEYEVVDGKGGSDTGRITIDVAGANDAPVAATLTALDEEDRNTVTIDLLANSTDLDGDNISVVNVSDAPNGTVTDNGDGTVTYVPDPDFNGTDTFDYTLSDGNGGESTGTVSVLVAAVNDAPIAVNDAALTSEGDTVVIDLLSNDSDIDGDVLSISAFGNAENGSITDNGDGTVSYTPNAGFSGEDSFIYTITDGNGGSATATATVSIEADGDTAPTDTDPTDPSAVTPTEIIVNALGESAGGTPPHMTVMVDGEVIGDVYVTSATETQYTFFADIIPGQGHKIQVRYDNDGVVKGVDRNLIVKSIAVNGQEVSSSDDSASYDRFDLDGQNVLSGRSTLAWDGTLVFDLSPDYFSESNNTSPIAEDVSYGGIEEDGAAQVFAYQASDQDGDTLSYSVSTQPTEGFVYDNGDGTFTFDPKLDFQDLSDGDTRQVSFTYNVTDGRGGNAQATATVTVTGTNDAPVAAILSALDEEDRNTVTIDLLAESGDLDGDNLTVIYVEDAPNGTATDNGDGTVTYVPDPDFNGTDTFSYTISDGNGGESTGTVSVFVAPVNDAPVALDDNSDGLSGTPIVVDLLTNDYDIDGDDLSIVGVSSANNGTVYDNGDGTVTYTPDAGFTGTDSFAYTVTDGNGGSATATATVIVEDSGSEPSGTDPAAPPPLATNEIVVNAWGESADGIAPHMVVMIDGEVIGDVFVTAATETQYTFFADIIPGQGHKIQVRYDNDGVVNGEDRNLFVSSVAVGGITISSSDPAVSYDRNDLDGIDMLAGRTAMVWNGTLVFDLSEDYFSSTLNEVVVNDDTAAVNEDGQVNIDLLANDWSSDNSILTIVSVEDPEHGTIMDLGDGTVLYTPDQGYSGADAFTYTVSDEMGRTATGQAEITINPDNSDSTGNDNPNAVGDVVVVLGIKSLDTTEIVNSDFAGDWQSNWPDLAWSTGWEYTDYISFNGGTGIRVNFNQGEFGKGLKFKSDFAGQERAYLEYDVRFGEGFDFVMGGKLPGLAGGAANSGGNKPDGTDGWSSRFMFSTEGKGMIYLYHPDQQYQWGEGLYGTGFYFEPGVTHTLAQEIIMNTPGQHDGVVRAWMDGELVVERTDIRFRDIPEIQVDSIRFETFFGGGDAQWAATKNEHIDFGNVLIEGELSDTGGQNPETVTIDLLANDFDNDGDDLSITDIGQAQSGSAINNGDGTVSYTPNSGFVGIDSFDYTITDGNGGEDTGTATVVVDPNAVTSLPTLAQFTFRVSGDHYNGAPEMNVFVDGVQLGGTMTVTADHGAGEWQEFKFDVELPEGAGEITIDYLNDVYGGSFNADRNLIVDYVEVNGVKVETSEGTYVRSDGLVETGQDNMYYGGSLTWNVSGRTDLFGQLAENTLIGGAGDDTLKTYDGDDIISAGNGNDILVGGSGDDILAGGEGNDTFVFGPSSGDDTVLDFTAVAHISDDDKIDLSSFGIANFDALVLATNANGDTVVDLGNGDRISLIGVRPEDLESSDFLF